MSRPRIRVGALRGADAGFGLDEQQELVVELLRRARGAPVTYASLRDAGIELPASVISELELAGWPIERCRPGRAPGPSVRLEPALDPGLEHGAESQARSAAQRPIADEHGSQVPLADGSSSARASSTAHRSPSSAPAEAQLTARPAGESIGGGDGDYRVYRSRPWAGLGEMVSGGRRRRGALLIALTLVICGCLLAGLAVAGAFSGPGKALEAARGHRHRPAGHAAAHVRRHRRSTRQKLPRRRSVAPSSRPTSAGPASSSTTTASAATTATSPSTAPQAGTTPAGSSSAAPATGGAGVGGATGGASSAIALDAQGHYLLESGNYAAAIPMLRRAMAATGESTGTCLQPTTQACLTYAYALYDLATALQREGDPSAAVPLLEQRLQIDNQRSVVRAELELARAQSRR